MTGGTFNTHTGVTGRHGTKPGQSEMSGHYREVCFLCASVFTSVHQFHISYMTIPSSASQTWCENYVS